MSATSPSSCTKRFPGSVFVQTEPISMPRLVGEVTRAPCWHSWVPEAAWLRSTATPTPKWQQSLSTMGALRFGAPGFPRSRKSRPGLALPRSTASCSISGVSSPQLDDAARGFSYRLDGALDMRMDPARGESAAAFIARASVRELTEVIRDYGEERFAQSIARAIAQARTVEPIVTTRQLAAVVAKAVGSRTRGDWRQDPAARTFQALRLAVNHELSEVSMALPRAVALLAEGGRLCVISFHSLEDRIVKRFIAWASQPYGGDPRVARLALRANALPGTPLTPIGRAIKPTEEEVARNPRSRSAVLRIAERTRHRLPSNWPEGAPGVVSP
jgi:hypothetical protein